MGAKHFEESDLNFPHLPEWRKHRSYPVIFLQEFHNIQGLLLLLLSHFSCVRLCATPETAGHQAPPSLGFSRQEHWSGLPFPSPMHECMLSCFSVMSDSMRPYGQQPTRLLCTQDSPGKNTGVGCHFLLQYCILVTCITRQLKFNKKRNQLCYSNIHNDFKPFLKTELVLLSKCMCSAHLDT
jgi:hypothetical protein